MKVTHGELLEDIEREKKIWNGLNYSVASKLNTLHAEIIDQEDNTSVIKLFYKNELVRSFLPILQTDKHIGLINIDLLLNQIIVTCFD